MVDSYLVRSLKRVHDQAAEDLEQKEPTSSETTAQRFNDLLEDFREHYPDKDRLDELDPVEGRTASIQRPNTIEPAKEDLRKIKLQTEQIADMFELGVGDFERVDGVGEMRPIVIQQSTQVSQETDVSQTIEYGELIERVDSAMVADDDAEELKDLIREFQEELENEGTDDSRLRDLAGRAKEIGAGVGIQVGAKLTMLGLERGYNLIP